MKILFVDDDIDVLEAISQTIDFSSVGITKPFFSTSATDAMSVISQEDIDILVTDIEMPGNSGIDLLQWVNHYNPSIVTIFCTCYADFNYAQRAIELHAFDYYLKPISSLEFSSHLEKAVSEVNRRHSTRKASKAKLWESLLIIGAPLPEADKYYRASDAFCICIAYMFSNNIPPLADELAQAAKCEADQSADFHLTKEASLSLFDNISCHIFSMGEQSPDSMREMLKQSCQSAKEHGIRLVYYYSFLSYASCSKISFSNLLDHSVNDVERKNALTDCSPFSVYPGKEYTSPNFESLVKAIEQQALRQALGIINQQLRDMALKHILSHNSLKSYLLDVTQVTHHVLNKYNINAHTLYSTIQFDNMEPYARQSVNYAFFYLRALFSTAIRALSEITHEESLARKVMNYIQENLSGDLSRDTIAEYVYLNPDYLARQFKKETSQSLSNYITQVRMEKAKTLLATTDKSVTTIASETGYENSSYFSHIFLQKTGMSPGEYRKSHAQKTT